MKTVLRFVAGVVAVLVGGVATGLGLIHLVVSTPLWLVAFAAIALIGFTLLIWGGRTVLSTLPIPRISVSIDRNG